MSNTVEQMVQEIKERCKQTSSSHKDEVLVMQSMLNDTSYEVNVYKNDGVDHTYNPSKDARDMVSRIISATTKVGSEEAKTLSEGYQFTKADANTMIGISKEFVNTYIQTGRKLPLGGRETSNVSLEYKPVEARTSGFPKKIGIDAEGRPIYTIEPTMIPAHDGIKASSPCPAWIVNNK